MCVDARHRSFWLFSDSYLWQTIRVSCYYSLQALLCAQLRQVAFFSPSIDDANTYAPMPSSFQTRFFFFGAEGNRRSLRDYGDSAWLEAAPDEAQS